MNINYQFMGEKEEIAKLGYKKTVIGLELNRMGIKKTGKGSKGNSYFNRNDYIAPLLELLERNRCYTHFWMQEETAFMIFGDETGANMGISMPWARVNIESKYNKMILDAMQEIGAGASYVKRYLEVLFFDLAEEDIADRPTQQEKERADRIKNQKLELKADEEDSYLFSKDKRWKLFNPPLKIKEEKKVNTMFAWAKTNIDGFEYDPNTLIKLALSKMLKCEMVESDSKKEFPLSRMGALETLIKQIKKAWEDKYIKTQVNEKMKGEKNEARK